ncbi:hypothetical protein DAPPUDRAFT_275001 [Daphnia pulex]|uniref:Uncharacterized protein n=1 Tax=Daphnia pulex TaxID=6669 RepID=E9I509_DAPPU|nr:hypothetical protein DAPPUDRAFT_275001 [Daphnia pulex]|eukprot:EFX60921.1 hypothetical protein DAPPUDRAFT_275001 [Daphnia pulex]
MKSFGLFASGANNSGDGSEQKSSELVVARKSCSWCQDINDQPADSFDVEPDFNQTVPQFLQSDLEKTRGQPVDLF